MKELLKNFKAKQLACYGHTMRKQGSCLEKNNARTMHLALPGWTTSRCGQDSLWNSQSEWRRTEINGESTFMVWPTLRSRENGWRTEQIRVHWSITVLIEPLSHSVAWLGRWTCDVVVARRPQIAAIQLSGHLSNCHLEQVVLDRHVSTSGPKMAVIFYCSHTCASIIKQCRLLPVTWRWCPSTGKAAVGDLESYWPCHVS